METPPKKVESLDGERPTITAPKQCDWNTNRASTAHASSPHCCRRVSWTRSAPDVGRSAAEGKQGSMKPLRGGEGGIAALRVMIDGGDDDALNNVVFGYGQLPQGGWPRGQR